MKASNTPLSLPPFNCIFFLSICCCDDLPLQNQPINRHGASAVRPPLPCGPVHAITTSAIHNASLRGSWLRLRHWCAVMLPVAGPGTPMAKT